MKFRYIAACAAFVFLCACNPAPKYARPSVPAPPSFKEAQGWKAAQPNDQRLGGNWWTLYNDPTLASLEEQAEKNNQSLIQAEANYRSARALIITARAELFPALTVAPAYTYSRPSSTSRGGFVLGTGGSGTAAGTGTGTTTSGTGSGSTGVAAVGNTGSFNNFTLPFDVSYTVDFWHRVRNQIAENVFNAQASAGDVATSRISIASELAQDYFELRSTDAQIKLYQETVANYREQLKLIQTLYNAGIDSEMELSEAQTQLDTAIAQMTDLGVARANYEHAIAVLTGQPPSTFSLPPATYNPNPPDIPVGVPSELLERRPDIAAAERRVMSANAAVGVAKAAYYPNLTLNASAGLQTSHITDWFTWPSRFWSLGPSFSETLLDFGARRGAVQGAEAQYDAAVAGYRQTVLTAFQNVEDNLSSLRILAGELTEERTAVTSASRTVDLSVTRFKAGVDSYLNVITAENTLLQNRQTELQIQLRQMTASVSLIMAVGGGWNGDLTGTGTSQSQPPGSGK